VGTGRQWERAPLLESPELVVWARTHMSLPWCHPVDQQTSCQLGCQVNQNVLVLSALQDAPPTPKTDELKVCTPGNLHALLNIASLIVLSHTAYSLLF
jgi:hypothetical protein